MCAQLVNDGVLVVVCQLEILRAQFVELILFRGAQAKVGCGYGVVVFVACSARAVHIQCSEAHVVQID